MRSFENFIANVKRLLVEKQMSRYKLAQLIDTNQSNISQFLSTKCTKTGVRLDTLDRFAAALEVHPYTLLQDPMEVRGAIENALPTVSIDNNRPLPAFARTCRTCKANWEMSQHTIGCPECTDFFEGL